MATIREQAAAIKGYASAIDAAIVAKGGTTSGGLVNAASAIAAIPSGDDFAKKFFLKTLDTVDLTEILGYSTITPIVSGNQRAFEGYSRLRSFNGPMYAPSHYAFSACTSLKDVVVRSVINNQYFFAPNTVTSLTTTAQTSSTIVGYALLLSTLDDTCVVTCSDKKFVRKIEGAWVVTETED